MYKFFESFFCFNPRPHAEGDQDNHSANKISGKVSIHALTRRATAINATAKQIELCFNPRPHAEGDAMPKKPTTKHNWFQSTPSRGGRRAKILQNQQKTSFNPRPHAEGDARSSWCADGLNCFNPRPHAEGDIFFVLTEVSHPFISAI